MKRCTSTETKINEKNENIKTEGRGGDKKMLVYCSMRTNNLSGKRLVCKIRITSEKINLLTFFFRRVE